MARLTHGGVSPEEVEAQNAEKRRLDAPDATLRQQMEAIIPNLREKASERQDSRWEHAAQQLERLLGDPED